MIDAEPGGAGANSFVTQAEADNYFAARLGAEAWTAAPPAVQERALLMAARILERLRWHGRPWQAGQALGWPRMAAPGAVDGEVPAAIRFAQCEEALAWLQPELVRRRQLQGMGVTDAGVQGAHERYRAGVPDLLSPEARALVRGWVRLAGTLVAGSTQEG